MRFQPPTELFFDRKNARRIENEGYLLMNTKLIACITVLVMAIVVGIVLLIDTPADETTTSVIVQATDLETAADAVRSVGGEITHELGVIRSVGANLTGAQLEAIGRIDGIKLHDNRTVSTASTCTVTGQASLNISKNKVVWDLTNNGSSAATIGSIEIVWPAANDKLKKIKFGKDIYKVASPAPSVVIDTGWGGNLNDRSIDPGQTKELKLEFEANALTDDSQYMLLIDFVGGCSAGFNLPQPTPTATPPPPTPTSPPATPTPTPTATPPPAPTLDHWVRDEFTEVGYDNQHGTNNWPRQWYESGNSSPASTGFYIAHIKFKLLYYVLIFVVQLKIK